MVFFYDEIVSGKEESISFLFFFPVLSFPTTVYRFPRGLLGELQIRWLYFTIYVSSGCSGRLRIRCFGCVSFGVLSLHGGRRVSRAARGCINPGMSSELFDLSFVPGFRRAARINDTAMSWLQTRANYRESS